MLWFCTFHVFVYVVLPTCLSWVIEYVYVGLHIMYMCVVHWAFVHLVCILVGSYERLMEYPIVGEWCALCTSQSYKCVYMRIPSSIDLQDYLVAMWYVFSWEIQILNRPLIISCWIFLLPLVKFSLVSHYGGVICYVHITSLENVYIWDIVT